MQYAKVLRLQVPLKDFVSALFLTVNSLIWYTLTYDMFSKALSHLPVSSDDRIVLYLVYYAGVGCSAVIGSIFFRRARRTGFFAWVIAGAITTLLVTDLASNSMLVNVLISTILGISAGVGLPSCLAFFADATTIEHRGVYGGIVWCAIGLGTFALASLTSMFGSAMGFLILAIWRTLGLTPLLTTGIEKCGLEIRNVSSYSFILRSREVMLYLVPWITFSLVNFAEAPVLDRLFGSSSEFIGFIEFALIGVFALVGGTLADLVGRKRVIMTGFVMFGIGYALLSLLSGFPVSWYLYTAFDGVAWGMFAAVFFMTLWGDLAGTHGKEKFYAIGGLPYLLAGLLPIIIEPYAGGIQTVTAFSLASFFLFLAVLPLMYATETLPEKKIKERELKGYIEKAKKAKEKYA